MAVLGGVDIHSSMVKIKGKGFPKDFSIDVKCFSHCPPSLETGVDMQMPSHIRLAAGSDSEYETKNIDKAALYLPVERG